MGSGASGDPCVSVLMPVYQAEATLAEAVESILCQSFDDLELIAVDDGSSDASPAILERLALQDDRIQVVRRPHVGIVRALNVGLAAARGALLARMDADDVSHPERLARQVAWLREHPECVAVGTGIVEVDPRRRPLRSLDAATDHAEIERMLLAGDGNGVVHATALYRTDALRRVGGYRDGFECGEDLDLHLRLGEIGGLANLPERLYEVRRRVESLTVKRRHQMRAAQDRAIAEALARRGLDVSAAPPRPPELPPQPHHAVWATWCNHAIESGHRATARHYAVKAFLAAPRRHWKLPIRALLGLRLFAGDRLRRRLRRAPEGLTTGG